MQQEEFKFPDEAPAEPPAQAEELQIQVEDDTPPEDRGRKPLPKEIVDELDKDDLEEYSEKVKKRLGQMKKVWHDERRAKEAIAREKEEALKFAQAQMEENRRLKQRLGTGEKAYFQEVTKAATNELAVAKEKLRQAYESGDADKIAEIQDALMDAKLKLREVERYQPALQRQELGVQPSQQDRAPQVPQPVLDPKAKAWQDKNTWFGVNKGMTAFALGLHEELVEAGLDPSSDDYYSRVDQTMRKRFSDYFGDDAEQTMEAEEKPAPRTKPANVVAPVTRGTAPRQVRLTSSQVALAKKLGISNEQYAREIMKLENGNG